MVLRHFVPLYVHTCSRMTIELDLTWYSIELINIIVSEVQSKPSNNTALSLKHSNDQPSCDDQVSLSYSLLSCKVQGHPETFSPQSLICFLMHPSGLLLVKLTTRLINNSSDTKWLILKEAVSHMLQTLSGDQRIAMAALGGTHRWTFIAVL